MDVPFKWHAIAVKGEVMSVSHSETTANFVHVARALDVMCRPKYRCLRQIISKSVPGYF